MNTQNSLPARLLLMPLILGLLLIVTEVSYAGELTYLALQREGQASVAIDEKKLAAYVIDLGRGGDGDQVMLENLPLLDRLEQKGVRNLYFVCSHPHSDHMGGIRALFRQPRVFFRDGQMADPRFNYIGVIDDGISKSLYADLRKSLGGNPLIKIGHFSATNRNAFAGISTAADDVYIETIPYPVSSKAGVHGRAVITFIRLGQRQTVVDFDDADSAAIQKAVKTLIDRGDTKIHTFVVPHHGSRYHDVAPILELKPERAIIAVNPANRYGHPSPPILQRLMENLPKENIVFTGSVQNVVLDDNGIKSPAFTAADKDTYAAFVAPNRLRAEKLGNLEDINACIEIQKMMDEGGGGARSDAGGGAPPEAGRRRRTTRAPEGGGGGAARSLLEEEVRLRGSILRPEFEFAAVAYGSDGIEALQGKKIFAYPLASTKDLAGREVAVVLERPVSIKNDAPDRLSPSEARGVLERLKLLGGNAERAKIVYVYFSSPTGLRDVLEPALATWPEELAAWSFARPPDPPPPPGRRAGPGGGPRPAPPRPRAPTNVSARGGLPKGGMVFLQGDKLFPVGEASELLGGRLDVCGTTYCVKTLGGGAYTLPFSPGPLFSEVWTRVYDRRIDSFYLSINPTKRLLRNLSAGMDRIPSGELKFGAGQAGGGIRTHEVVTSGDIKGTLIGKILWEADVAFKSRSLRYNVLTGGRDAFFGAPLSPAREESADDGGPPVSVPYKERWCRLYWTSGAQGITVDRQTGTVGFKGEVVVARSEPMVMRGGDLVDEPRGSWCGESKSVAASLQRQANSGVGGPAVLQQLRQLAEMQSFVRWARDNGVAPTEAFTRRVGEHNSPHSEEVPTWTSGIKTEPRVVVRQEGSLAGGSNSNYLNVSVAEESTVTSCVLPYWGQQEHDFPANGITRRPDGVWSIPAGKYQYVDGWMASLARKIAACSGGAAQLQAPTRSRAPAVRASRGTERFGVRFSYQSIRMHGGVLLGVREGFLESAWKDKGLLLSPTRRPLFQSADGKLHFWNYSEGHRQFGTLAQHVVIDGGEVKGARASEGRLTFTVATKPGGVALQESRWGRAGRYADGLEWAGARHGSDGAWIWQKAAWPCAGGQGAGCVRVSQTTLEDLASELDGGRDSGQLIWLARVGENTWRVDLNISGLRSELDRRWKATPSSNLNARVSLIYEYAKWGFVEDAFDKYEEVVGEIEGDTVDTILLKLLRMSTEGN